MANVLRETGRAHTVLWRNIQLPEHHDFRTQGSTYSIQMAEPTKSKEILRLGEVQPIYRITPAAEDQGVVSGILCL